MNDNIEVNVDFIINNPQVMADSAKVKADVLGVADTAEKAVERVNKSVKTIFSDSQAEVDAYVKSMGDATGRVADSGKNELIRLLNEDLKLGLITAKELEEELIRMNNLKFSDPVSSPAAAPKFSESYTRVSSEGLEIYKNLDPVTQRLILRNIELKDELGEVSEAQKELNQAFDNGAMSGSKFSQAQAALSAKEANIKGEIKSTTAELVAQGKAAELAAEKVKNAGQSGFDKIGNAITKPVGQLERLKYAAAAYEKMSATSYNPEIISKYNRKLQETSEEIERTKNLGKEGFDEIGNAVEDNGISVSSLYGKAKEFAEILPGIGLAGLAAFAVGPILEYLDTLHLFEAEITQSEIAAEKLGRALVSPNYASAVKNISELKLNIELAMQGFLDKEKVLNQYNGSIGKTTGQVKNLEDAEKNLAKNADAYIKMTLLKAAAQLALDDAAKEAYQSELARQEGDLSGKDMMKSKNLSVWDRVKAAFVQDSGYTEALLKANTAALVKDSESAIEDGENIAKKFQTRAAEIAKKYKFNFFDDDDDGKKPKKGSDAIINERQELLNKIADMDAEFARKGLTKDQEEIAAVHAKFNEIRRAVEEFNKKNPKKAISLVAFEKVEENAVEDLKSQLGVQKYQQDIAAQKQIFDQFEQYKLEFGLAKANERFGSELKGFENYIAYLRSLMPADTDQSAGANALRDLLNKTIPAAEKEQSQKTFDNTTKALKKVLELSETAALQRLAIEKKHAENVAAINSDPTIGEVEKAARIRKLDDIRIIELKANKQIAFEESEFYKSAMKDVTNASITELKQRLKDAKAVIANANLTPEEREAIKGKLTAAEQTLSDKGFNKDKYGQFINENSKASNQAKEISEYAQAASGSFYEMAGALKEIAPGTADTLETLGDIAGVAANAAGAVASFAAGDIVGGIKGTISAIAGVFAIGAKARESERKALAEVKEYQDKILQGEIELNIEMRSRARTQQDINALTKVEIEARKSLLATQASQSKTDYERQLALVQAGLEVTAVQTEKYGGFLGIGRKTKTVYDTASLAGKTYEELEALSIAGRLDEATEKLFQGLKKSKDEMVAIGESAEDLAKIVTDKLTGGLTADSISNTIVQGFKEGKRALIDFADDTQDLVQNALLSALAYNFLSEPLKKLVAQFGEDAQDGLNSEEIKKFEKGLGDTTDVFLKAADAVEKATGVKFGAPDTKSSNSLAGAYATASQPSIDLLSGRTAAMGQSLNDMNGLLRSSYLKQLETAANTHRTAVNTDRLENIETQLVQMNRKMNNSGDAATAAGFKI